ncbi:MAG: hypothetical protein P8Z75_08725 [Gammaproteobacteria bacterium]
MQDILPKIINRCSLFRLFILAVLLLGLTACAGTSDELQLFNLAQMRYEQALRWQDYQGVVSFHKDAYKHASREGRKRFKQFKVTEYKVVSDVMEPDMRHDTQTVEIHYYNTDYQIVHSMMLRNRWEYNPKTNRWFLLNPMPKFK